MFEKFHLLVVERHHLIDNTEVILLQGRIKKLRVKKDHDPGELSRLESQLFSLKLFWLKENEACRSGRGRIVDREKRVLSSVPVRKGIDAGKDLKFARPVSLPSPSSPSKSVDKKTGGKFY